MTSDNENVHPFDQKVFQVGWFLADRQNIFTPTQFFFYRMFSLVGDIFSEIEKKRFNLGFLIAKFQLKNLHANILHQVLIGHQQHRMMLKCFYFILLKVKFG